MTSKDQWIAYGRRMKTAILWLLVAAACGKSSGGSSDDPGVQYVVDGAKEAIPKIKAAIAAGTPSAARYDCAHMANLDTLTKADAKLAGELKQLCTHDLLIATMKVSVEKAEIARKAKPDEKVLSECFDAEYEVARTDLVGYHAEDESAKAIEARFATACPK
jgi:hypothetical protein